MEKQENRTIKIKPLTVNRCWTGRRFKTEMYLAYERELFYLLPALKVPKGKLRLTIKVGVSSSLSDIDNIAKPFIDILQKKYEFNDKLIYQLIMTKEDVKKGEEYIRFQFTELLKNL